MTHDSPRLVLTALLLATSIVATSPALAQESQPPTCADSLLGTLGALLGEWDLSTVFRTQSGGWDTTSARVHIAPDLDGCLLREDYAGTRFGQPYHALSLWGVHGIAAGAAIQRVTGHSQHGLLTLYTGGIMGEGDSLVLAYSQPIRGVPVLFQHIFSPFGTDSMRFTSRRSTDDGATWRVTWFADYRRRPDE